MNETGPRPRMEVETPPATRPRPWPEPRIETEALPAARLEAPLALVEAAPRVAGEGGAGTPALMLAGASVLVLGLTGLSTANFVADQFARSAALGWATLAVSVSGFGLVGTGIWRELRGLLSLRRVDRLRAALGGSDAVARHKAARQWLGLLPEGAALAPAIDAVNDPDAILALLRAGPEAAIRGRAEALGRAAAMQVVAGMAAMPSPALTVLLVTWRGLRLVRQVAALCGVRPGLIGTLGLVRRTVMAAGAAAGAEAAANAAAHALLSNPLLQHVAGEMAGAGVAARRMVVLAKATCVACSPIGEK